MAKRDIIVIGASAGGVEALQKLCAMLPADLPATIFIAQHISPTARSLMPLLLSRAGPLQAMSPRDGDLTSEGTIYVASPDLHMLVRRGSVLMRRGPVENRTRPAVNALFRSAAVAYGSRVIGVVLTGLLDDGTEGLIAIKAAGGLSVVQDPTDAQWPSMPKNAIKRDHVDYIVPVAALAELLGRLCRGDAGPNIPLPSEFITEDRIAAQDFAVMNAEPRTPGQPSHVGCPDCGGVLNQIVTGDEIRFRCQVGHAYTPLGLAQAQSSELERALGVAVRTHKDRIKLFEQMSDNARTRELPHAVSRWEGAQAEAEQMIRVLENAMASLTRVPVESEA